MAAKGHLLDFTKQPKQENQDTLFNHVSKIVRTVSDPKNSLGANSSVEVLSNHIKNTQFKYRQPSMDTDLVNQKKQQTENHEYLEKAQKIQHQASTVNTAHCILSNIDNDYKALKTASISFGRDNYYALAQALRILAVEKQAKQLRFWGKILGLKDYWIIQGVSSKKNTDEYAKNVEAVGTGVNFYSYWVAHDIRGDWSELPVISQEQLKASRDIKHIFTGDLDAAIHHYPPFPGKQKHLLKAQIVRITHSCELSPKGLYKVNEENNTVIDFEDEFKSPEVADLNSLEAWVHTNQYILNQGRCSYYVDPTLTEEQKEALNTENAEKDPLIQRLKPISQDKPLEKLGYTTNWGIQQMGETQVINLVGKQEGQTTCYGVVLLKNLSWPGAYTVGYSGGWVNVYVGYGHKVSQVSFNPSQPKDLAVEGEDRKEYSEPNPSKPIMVVVEPQAPKPEDPPAD